MAVLSVLAVHVLADECDITDDPTSMLQNVKSDRTLQGKQAEPLKIGAVFISKITGKRPA